MYLLNPQYYDVIGTLSLCLYNSLVLSFCWCLKMAAAVPGLCTPYDLNESKMPASSHNFK